MTAEPAVTERAVADNRAAFGARATLVRWAVRFFGLTTFLAGLVVFFSIRSDQFLTYSNIVIILSTVAVIGIVSLGQTFVIISGGFDLSVSGAVPLGAVVFAKLLNSGLDIPLALAGSVGTGAVLGVVNGLLVTWIGINPLIATLGTLSISSGVAFTITDGLTENIEDLDAGKLAETAVWSVPNSVWTLLLLAVVSFAFLRFTYIGRALYAIGGNREAAWLAGIRVHALTTLVYVLSGGLAALAGVVLASELLAGSGTIGTDSALNSITAVILGGGSLAGGVGGIFGTLTGVLVIGALSNGLTLIEVPSFYQQIATGLVLLIAVGFGRVRVLLESR